MLNLGAIKELKIRLNMYLPEVRFFVHLPSLLLHHVEELGKVDCAVAVHVDLEHQVEQLVLGGVLAHGPHHAQ